MDEFLPDEDLLRYLDNEMETHEKQELERLIKERPLLAERLQNLQVAIEAVRQVGTVNQVAHIHQQMINELTLSQAISRRRRIARLSLSVAASLFILLILAGGWWVYQLSGEKVYNQYFISYSLAPARGGDSAGTIQKLYAANAFLKIDSLAQSGSSYSSGDSLLIALSFLEIEKIATAIQWLQPLEQSATSFRQDATYYLGMAYLKAKRYREALSRFEQIRSEPQHLYHGQVSSGFLRKLKFLIWK
jgi:hypothetical protein